uniref:Uncharacterized protein n=1 Tax=Fagus sylvatica TaxID=28930 RepID=A0A2N9FV91_FAGSY
MAASALLLRVEADWLPPVSTATDPPSTANDRLPPLLLKQISSLPSPRPLIGSLPSWISFLNRLAPGE